MNDLTHIDLFSGVGGFALAAGWAGFRTVAFVEIDKFCQRVLREHWSGVPVYDDVTTFGWSGSSPTLITGGFPCQDISYAGLGAGIMGKRSGLWFEYARIIRDLGPKFVIVENVAALLDRGMGEVLGTLDSIGYDAEWHCIPAAYVGAPHFRDRVWIIAYSRSQGASQHVGKCGIQISRTDKEEIRRVYWDKYCLVNRGVAPSEWGEKGEPGCRSLFPRNDDGVPDRLDRDGSLGNSITVPVAYQIIKAIAKIERGKP